VAKKKSRAYQSPVRDRQAGDTRQRIIEATRQLLQADGYAGMTIEAIARRAAVSAPSVYAIFKSKTGILTALLDQSTFGAAYEDAVRRTLSTADPEMRLRSAAGIARQIHEAQCATFDLLRGAGVVAPELAKLARQREDLRYGRQEILIISLGEAKRLRSDLDHRTARDIFWMFTGPDVYRMLVCERGWSSRRYEEWLAEALVENLLNSAPKRNSRATNRRGGQ
jgi:AcrR family transcriptional regulator